MQRSSRQMTETDPDEDLGVERRRLEADESLREQAARVNLWDIIKKDPSNFPLQAASWNILIEMYEPAATMGSAVKIVKTQAQIEQEQYLTVIGRVLRCGPTAFEGRTTSGINCAELTDHIQTPDELEGRYVIIQRYVGNEIFFAPYPAKKLRFITLQEILAVTTVPSMWMRQ